jgi:hypothetical protein
LIEGLAPSGTTPEEQKNNEPTPEQTAIIGDLHWLIHQGHVIEFADGLLETAKKPAVRPPKAEAKAPAQNGDLPGTKGETVPNASVEEIEPKVAELEATPLESSQNDPGETSQNSEPEKNMAGEPTSVETVQEPAPNEVPAQK